MTEAGRGTRGPYAKTAEVRRRILESAMRAFAESGYRATTMKNVAEMAGISQRGLVHHFASKEELLTAVLERYDHVVAEQLPPIQGQASLAGIVDLLLDNEREPWLAELYSILSTEAISPEHPAHAYYRQRYRTFRLHVEEAFETMRRSGQLSTAIEPTILAAMFTSLVEGLRVQWLYDRASIDVAAVLQQFLSEVAREQPRA